MPEYLKNIHLSAKKSWFFVSLVLLALIIPTSITHAQVTSAFVNIATKSISGILSYIFFVIFSLIGDLTIIVVKLFDYLVYIRIDNGMPVITQTWTIFRNFCNLFFIAILVYMAFATIFNTKNYTFTDLIWRLLIVAVLINFSLAIGGLVINACQVLTNVFLTSIGDPGNRIGTFLNPSTLLNAINQANGGSSIDILSSAGITLIFSIILSAIFLFSLLTATIFALFRIFILWGLLIVSPFAWMALILPGTRGRFAQWWKLFLGWNLFLPIYLFFMYLGLVFLSQQSSIVAAVQNSQYGTTAPIAGMGSLTINLTFFYCFAAFIMGGSTWAAMKLTTQFGGGGFEWAVKGGQGFINKYVPGFNTYQAGKGAAQQRAGELFGGAGTRLPWLLSQNKQAGAFNRGLGVQGAEYKDQKDFVTKAKTKFDNLEDDYDAGKLSINDLRTRAGNTNALSADGYAYRKLAIQKGALDSDQFKKSLVDLQNNPQAVKDFVKTAKDAKFVNIKDLKKVALDPSLRNSNLIYASRELLSHIASDTRLASNFTTEELGAAISILGGKSSPESTAFLKDLEKVRPDLVDKYRRDNGMLEIDKTKGRVLKPEEVMAKSLNTEPKNIASMHKDVWNSQAFKDGLRNKLYDPKISQQARNKLRNNLEDILAEQGDDTKLGILNGIAPKDDFPNQPAQQNQGGGSSQSSRVNQPDVNPGNVINLRQGEKRSPGGIILTPGAQFDIDKENSDNK